MVHAPEMIRTHPQSVATPQLIDCVEACFDCLQTCITCADACLGEEEVANLVRCIRTNQDCADVCLATGSLLSRQTQLNWTIVRLQLETCVEICQSCAEECGAHASHMEHCRICAEACTRCMEACRALLATI
jgi:hypothetical protein